MSKYISLLVFLLCTLPLSSQDFQVSGMVVDKETGEPLPGCHISLTASQGTVSGIDGFFTLSLPAGNHLISFTYTGYKDIKHLVSGKANDTLTIKILLARKGELLSQVVVSSSKFEKPLAEVTVSMDILNAGFIESNNSTTLDEALNRASGVTIIGGQPNIRGGSGYSYGAGSRVMILMNDLPILTGDAGYPNWSFIPLENVYQVEIIKGASSALYGSSALNGIVNLRTDYAVAKPKTKVIFFNGMYDKPSGNITDEIAGIKYHIVQGDTQSIDTTFVEKAWWKGRIPIFNGAVISHAEKFGRFDFVAGAYLYSEESYLKDDYEKRGRISLSSRFIPKNNKRLSVSLSTVIQVNKSATFFIWNGSGSKAYLPLQNTVSNNSGFRMTLDPTVTLFTQKGGRHKIMGRYYKADNLTDKEQGTLSDYMFGEYQYQHHFDSSGLVLTGGLTGSYTYVEAELYGDTVHTSSNIAIFLQADKKILDRVNVSLGFRYERNQLNKGNTETKPVGRIGVNYQAAPFTYLRASFGQGYRFPTIAEKFVRTDVGVLNIFPNPELNSETGWSTEVGIKQGLKLGDWEGFADAAWFWMQYQDMMEFTFGGVDGTLFGFQSVNIGNTNIWGAEFSIAGKGNIGKTNLQTQAGYTYIDPKFQEFDSVTAFYSSADYNVLKYRFRHIGNFDLQADRGKWIFGTSCQYYSFMESVDYIFELLLPGVKSFREANNKGEWVLDINLGFKMSKRARLNLIVKNICNNEYTMRPASMEAPRSFTLQFVSEW